MGDGENSNDNKDDEPISAAYLMEKFDKPRPETPDNIRLTFKMPSGELISGVFPKCFSFADLY